MFNPVESRVDFQALEKRILEWWDTNDIPRKYRGKNEGADKRYSFIDGPITANNPMGVHHAWGRTYKDLFLRYKAMQGYDQRFQNGFDGQGLWIEVEVEKELGFKSKREVIDFGIEKFVNLCKERVDKYTMFFDSVRFDMNQKYVILDNEVSTLRKALVEYMSSSSQDYASSTKPALSDEEYRKLYEKYYRFYINEKYDSSIQGFRELLDSNRQHDLSENCQYWMGEAYYAKGQYDIALDTFQKVFDFPNEKKEDDAQLKIGICYIKLDDNAKAKKELQIYIDQYPRGEFVSKAKSYLTQLD